MSEKNTKSLGTARLSKAQVGRFASIGFTPGPRGIKWTGAESRLSNSECDPI